MPPSCSDGLEGAEAAAVERQLVVVQRRSGFGDDIDDACGSKSELGRQASVDEGDGADDSGIQFLAETIQPFRQEDAVNAIRQVVVFAADVKLAEGIFHHARALGEAPAGTVHFHRREYSESDSDRWCTYQRRGRVR